MIMTTHLELTDYYNCKVADTQVIIRKSANEKK